MLIFPAVDILNGHAVRLLKGRKENATIYADNPRDLALKWRDQGSEWLHMIDLDGAFAGQPINAPLIGEICHKLGMSIQVGGGIRDAKTARAYLDAGATRLIVGTMALERPDEFADLCGQFPGRIGVSLDAENGKLKSRGWVKDAGMDIAEVAPRMEEAGAAFIIYTDISRDGTRKGVNLAALRNLLSLGRLPVMAAGGVSTLEDVRAILPLAESANLEGVISGRALCEGSLDLAEAIKLTKSGWQ